MANGEKPSDLERRRANLSPEKQEILSRRLRGAGGHRAEATRTIPRRAEGQEAPLSFSQERLWFLDQLTPGDAAFNENAVLHLRGTLDVSALEKSLVEILRRHEVLRTLFRADAATGQARQIVQPVPEAPLTYISLSGIEPSRGASELMRRLKEEAKQPIDLARGPVFRTLLFALAPDHHALLVVNHHIVSDGWSRSLLIRELAALYAAFSRGERSPLAELPIQYGDFAAWQRTAPVQEGLARSLASWKERLKPPLAMLSLPADRARPEEPSGRGGVVRFAFPTPLRDRLHELCRAEGATLFMVLLAGFDALLHRHSGQTDLVVGTPTANRTRPETEGLLGFFVNNLVMRVDLSGDPSFSELIARVRQTSIESFANAEVPFEKLVEELRPERQVGLHPFFQTMFTLQNVPRASLELPGLEVEIERLDVGTSRLDLTLEVAPDAAGSLSGHIEYNADLFTEARVERLARRYLTLLEGACEDPRRTLSRLPLLPASERQQVIEEWNQTEAAVAPGTIDSCFEEQVRRTPDALALMGRERLTYQELDARARRLARLLGRYGVGPEVRVGLCLQSGPDLVIALLAVLKAGGAYVPLDPAYPEERLRLIVQDAGISVLLTTLSLRGSVPAESAEVLCLDAEPSLPEPGPGDPSIKRAARAHAAYVMYTSGSTGRPKGVVVTHENVLNFFVGMDARVPAPGRLLARTSFAFDISVLELLWTLARGFSIVVQGVEEEEAPARLPSQPSRAMQMSLFFFAADEDATTGDKYHLLQEAARFGDRNHFSAVWIPERHFHSFGGLYPSPAVVGAALAAITDRIAIRAGSVVLPLHHPARVAEDWSVLDNLSRGRVGISFASGWHADDFVLSSDAFAERRTRMYEGIEIVRRLWRGEAVAFRGGAGNEVMTRIRPRPIQKELPFWVTASGDPKTFEAAGRLGAGILTHLLGQSPSELASKISLYREARKQAGHEGEGHVTLMLHTFVGDDLEQVKQRVRGPFCNYLRTSLELIRNLAQSLGLDIDAEDFSQDDLDALLARAFDRYFETSSLMGTVESCLGMLDTLRDMGVDEIGCLIDFGVPSEAVLAALPKLDELRRLALAPRQARRTLEQSLAAQFSRHDITHFQCTPSAARLLLQEEKEGFGPLGVLLVGGETLPPALAQALSERVPELHNMYGPTETTVWSSTHRVARGEEGTVPIGRPIANTRLYILDPTLQLLPPGAAGELYIAGAGVTRGYHNRPELTAERYLPDPFSRSGGSRMYRTGDLARWREDGSVEFVGRNDHQIKLRGFRIELGEIESVLSRHPGIRQAVAVIRGAPEDPRLVAFFVPRFGLELSTTELRAYLRERLPDYMIPSVYLSLEALPLTPNGKVDRGALPNPELGRPAMESAYVAPRTALEQRLAELWASALGIQQVGVNDDFFELGGHSLVATQLVVRIRSELRVEFPLRAFLERPTVAALAQLIEGSAAAA